jgi:hypothetical protein
MYEDPQRVCGVVREAITFPLTQVWIWPVVRERWNSMQYQVLAAIAMEPESDVGLPSGMMESSNRNNEVQFGVGVSMYLPLARFQSKTPNCPPMRKVCATGSVIIICVMWF